MRQAIKPVKIFSHIIIQIMLFRLRGLIVPIRILVQYNRFACDQTFAYLGDAQHIAVFIFHISIKRRVDPQPFFQLRRIDAVDHVAIRIVCRPGHTRNIARRNIHRKIHLVQGDCQMTAIHTFARRLMIVVYIDGIELTKNILFWFF